MSTHVSSVFGPDHNEVRRNLIREMNRLGVVRLEGEYSGGHDEGGLQTLLLYKPDGKVLDQDLSYDDALWQAVDSLLETKFYSWALGMSVYGTVFVDLETRRAWTEGEEERFAKDEDPIDWRW